MQHATRIGDSAWHIGTFVALLLVLLAAATQQTGAVLSEISGGRVATADRVLTDSDEHGPDTPEPLLQDGYGLPLNALAEPRPHGGGSALEVKELPFSSALPFGRPESHPSFFTSRTFADGAPSRPLRHWLGVYLL